jgi:hypothetical protein
MKHQIETQIEIAATPETVWNILTDLDAYSDWNPFVVSAAGRVAVGERLTNRIQSPGGRAMTFKPTVTTADPEQKFEWLGRLVLPGVMDGRHTFQLHATEVGTRLTHGESFNGILVRLMRKSLDNETLEGFNAMNEALKTRAEAHDGNQS